MDDNARSTTPPLPPPDFTESLLQRPQEPSKPQSAISGLEDHQEPGAAAADHIQNSEMEPEQQESRPSSQPRPGKTAQSLHGLRNNSQEPNGNGRTASPAQVRLVSPEGSDSPGTPASLPLFDWDELEAKFEKSLADANAREDELMADFEAMVKYFTVWSSAASAHDNERAVKRLQTRSHFVKLREDELESRRQNYEQVVQAFQSAMLLLKRAQA